MVSNYVSRGLFKENPIFILALGLCPALAVSGQVSNALGMGVGVIFVLFASNTIVSLLKDFIPQKVRIPAYIVIIATFVTMVDLFLQAFVPALSESLGVFVKLMVVNCVILGRAEAFARVNSVGASMLDALGMGLGFTLGLTAIALVREILGSGTITLFPMGDWDGVIRVPALSESPIRIFSLPAGALLVMGYLKGLLNWQEMKRKDKERKQAVAA